MREQVSKQLYHGLWYSLLIGGAGTLLLTQIVFSNIAQGFEGGQAVILITIMSCLWVGVLVVCSLTTFFNLSDDVRNSNVYSFLAFYFTPTIATIALAVTLFNNEHFLSLLFELSVPFFAIHTYFYIRFKNTKFDNWSSDDAVS